MKRLGKQMGKLLGQLPGRCAGLLLAGALACTAQAQTNIDPNQIAGPSLSVWMTPATLTVGQTGQVNWVSDFGAVVHIECVASAGGFVFPGTDAPASGSPTIGPAAEAWVANPSTCTITATLEGDPGTTIKQLVIATNAPATPPALALTPCSTNSPSTAPTAATTSCTVTNTGGTALSSISYSSIAGLTVSGPTGACAANSTCGTLLVSTGTTAGGPYTGTLTATPNTGSAAQVVISLTVNPAVPTPAALALSPCSTVSPSTAPTAATTSCTVTNTGGTAVSSISYSSIAGLTVSGPTGACAANSTCGTLLVSTGTTAGGPYSGTLTATPNTGSTAQVTISLTVNPAAGGEVVTYIHTDGLGSPVARTNASGVRISLTKYEAYGLTLAGSDTPTVGFTGHFHDADTGLTYMQQRYYDPVAARFMSEDPVLTDAETGSSFNRYVYGNNNPYRYIDPDGREDTPVYDKRDDELKRQAQKEQEKVCGGGAYCPGGVVARGSSASDSHSSAGESKPIGSYLPGTEAGANATQYWANMEVETGNSLYMIPGLFSALWTPDTAVSTAMSLGSVGTGLIRAIPKGIAVGSKSVVGVMLHTYPKAGGFGLNFHVAPWGRVFAVDYHRFGGATENIIHYHRGLSEAIQKLHRPFQGGW